MSMILYNGKVYLEKNNFAEAIYIDGNIIKDVGTNEAILAHKTEDMQLIDVGGKTVIPGLNDSHAHVLFMGNYLTLYSFWVPNASTMSFNAAVNSLKPIRYYLDRC